MQTLGFMTIDSKSATKKSSMRGERVDEAVVRRRTNTNNSDNARGKQEVTTELAKILTVLKTTLQTGSISKDMDSSSSDEESGLHQVKAKNPQPVTGKPPRPPMKSKKSDPANH